MARLPFDPARIPSPTPAAKPRSGDGAPLSVTQANRLVKDTLAQTLPVKIRIVGQVSNFNDRSHWYFSLKDSAASLRCVCFASAARKSGIPMTDGLEVVVTGRFDVYDAQGQLQFYVDKVEPVGQGALEMQYRALCEELRAKGYFDPAHKKKLPLFPRRVAVVTSHAAAALQDVINTAARRWQGCQLFLVDVRVQGAGAAAQIAQAIEALSRQGKAQGIDAILLTRGGGSIEDLWAFNERIVADAIFRCTLPLIAAIGHETDTTIAELVADVRSSTPTQAAMTLIPDRQAWEHQVQQQQRRLGLLMQRLVDHARHRIDAAARHRLFRRPVNMLGPLEIKLQFLRDQLSEVMGRTLHAHQRQLLSASRHLAAVGPVGEIRKQQQGLETLASRLSTGTQRTVAQRANQLEALTRHLGAVDPSKILRRGYTYTLDDSGRPLTSALAVTPGDALTTVFADGRVSSRVLGQTPPSSAAPTPKPSAVSPRRKKPNARRNPTDAPPGLFQAMDPSSDSPS